MQKIASKEEKNMVVNDIMNHFHPEELLDLKNFLMSMGASEELAKNIITGVLVGKCNRIYI